MFFVYFPLVSLVVNTDSLSTTISTFWSASVFPETRISVSIFCHSCGVSRVINALYIVIGGVWYFLGGLFPEANKIGHVWSVRISNTDVSFHEN